MFHKLSIRKTRATDQIAGQKGSLECCVKGVRSGTGEIGLVKRERAVI
jgi:hypothetical protein